MRDEGKKTRLFAHAAMIRFRGVAGVFQETAAANQRPAAIRQ
jgi:hypothetical protein